MNKDVKKAYRLKYVGKTIVLTAPIEDPYSPKPAGSKFTVTSVDDELQLHGFWEDGSAMAINPNIDQFEIF